LRYKQISAIHPMRPIKLRRGPTCAGQGDAGRRPNRRLPPRAGARRWIGEGRRTAFGFRGRFSDQAICRTQHYRGRPSLLARPRGRPCHGGLGRNGRTDQGVPQGGAALPADSSPDAAAQCTRRRIGGDRLGQCWGRAARAADSGPPHRLRAWTIRPLRRLDMSSMRGAAFVRHRVAWRACSGSPAGGDHRSLLV
jgi:hypothetical protein